MPGEPDPCVIVIFGASGDLTARKLIPALYELDVVGTLPRETCVLGVSRTLMSDDAWRDHLQPGTAEHAKGYDPSRWEAFAKRLFYFAGDATVAETYAEFTERIETLSRHFKCHGNVLFYLSVTPSLYEPIVHRIDESSLILEGRRWCSLNREAMPWQRCIVEKPFGHGLESAHTLNLALGRVFAGVPGYRIHHYPGTDLVHHACGPGPASHGRPPARARSARHWKSRSGRSSWRLSRPTTGTGRRQPTSSRSTARPSLRRSSSTELSGTGRWGSWLFRSVAASGRTLALVRPAAFIRRV